ncbi:Metallo-dependent hydrolase [Piromyces finnis]|uniref:Metallo-dependent hydrolase n=1 Tax=Piromyces finnis TaxID=1754191 RepID=A0A1Y1UY88_9FUNG|nr:Metallo-dependent hydrolase [Piromyces finnis]|eukprot:ORX43229.1 Metallo-dependent hydrolase [Piromyces finnis]
MNNYIFDSHCHIQNSSITEDDRDISRYEMEMSREYSFAIAKKIQTLPLNSVGMMSTTIEDSRRMCEIITILKEEEDQMKKENKELPVKAYYGFGIHPWFCENTLKNHEDWQQQLEKLVIQYPKATIGECGLDKVARNYATKKPFSMPVQTEFFEFQFRLAAKYQRPIIIHSVKTVGKLFEFIRKELKSSIANIPPKIMFHSYCGSVDITRSLLNLTQIRDRFYFGFSFFVNSRIQHNLDILTLIPKNRILIETDLHEMDDVPEAIEKIYQHLKSYSSWSSIIDDFYQLTYENAKDFFTF